MVSGDTPRRIRDISAIRDRLRFVHGDGLDVMATHGSLPDAVFFIDPPYTVAGRRLYVHNSVDHVALFRLTAQLAGDVLMTYDDAPEIRHLAERHGLQVRRVPMKTTHHDEKFELLVGREFSWLDSAGSLARCVAV